MGGDTESCRHYRDYLLSWSKTHCFPNIESSMVHNIFTMAKMHHKKSIMISYYKAALSGT